jgi:hypothetical protein
MIKDTNITALFTFSYVNLDVEISHEDGGTVTGVGIHECGSTVSVRAIPNACYTFSH